MHPTRIAALAASVLATAACYDFNITNPNAPTSSSVYGNPTRANLAALATGMFDQSRNDITSFIWRIGSMGREGANEAGNNQPDYIEPFLGPLSPSEFGGALWFSPYVQVRNANSYIDAAPHSPDLSPGEIAASIGFGKTMKALAFMYIVESHGPLGAPVDVDRPPNAPLAPFVSEDSVYRTILDLLADARTQLGTATTAGVGFPFTLPPGYSLASDPASFAGFTWMLTAKINILRTTGLVPCGPTCDQAALDAIAASGFYSTSPANFGNGVNFDFGTGPGDTQNDLSDPLSSITFYAMPVNLTDAKHQVNDTASTQPLDQRVLNKITGPGGVKQQQLTGLPDLPGSLKFTIYFTGGSADPTHPVPIIRDEELVLLKAEAEIGLGQLGAAVTDLNAVRVGSGNLAPYSGPVTVGALTDELLYNRRYSLLWEQGVRWIDARRYGRLSTIEPIVGGGKIPATMPIPSDECQARGLGSSCSPLGT